jgi:hypothetical protein
MPFGKYRGVVVEALPEEYLTWLWENIDLREPLRTAVEEALDGHTEPPVRTKDVPAVVKHMAQEIITTGYRALAHRHHPDKGGSHDAMIRLGQARDWLNEEVMNLELRRDEPQWEQKGEPSWRQRNGQTMHSS